jgi:Tfp pilus assembly protein PilX
MHRRAFLSTMRPGNQRGIVVVLSLLVLAILAVLMTATLRLATSEVTLANNQHDHSQAGALAESGLEFALAQLNGGGNPVVTNQPMDVNGLAIGSFSTVLTWASPTNVLVVATSMTTGPRSARSTCRVRLHQDPVTERWAIRRPERRSRGR